LWEVNEVEHVTEQHLCLFLLVGLESGQPRALLHPVEQPDGDLLNQAACGHRSLPVAEHKRGEDN